MIVAWAGDTRKITYTEETSFRIETGDGSPLTLPEDEMGMGYYDGTVHTDLLGVLACLTKWGFEPTPEGLELVEAKIKEEGL